MERETSSLLIKANRVLGMRLVESGLTSGEAMEEANAIFIERARAKELARASLLRILLFETGALKERDLLNYQLSNLGIGAVEPANFRSDPSLLNAFPLELMRASWVFPIDHSEEHGFVATSYYMSGVVRGFWEERLQEKVHWYASPMEGLDNTLSTLEGELLAQAAQGSREGS